MTLIDCAILLVIVLAILGGLSQGFLRSIFALAGLLGGLVLAAWNYGLIAPVLMPLVRVEQLANAIAFMLIALLVMGLAAIVGKVLSKTSTMHWWPSLTPTATIFCRASSAPTK